jgi:hypothetical protein
MSDSADGIGAKYMGSPSFRKPRDKLPDLISAQEKYAVNIPLF